MPAGDSSFHLEIGTSVPRDRLHLSRVSFPACDKAFGKLVRCCIPCPKTRRFFTLTLVDPPGPPLQAQSSLFIAHCTCIGIAPVLHSNSAAQLSLTALEPLTPQDMPHIVIPRLFYSDISDVALQFIL